MREQCSLALLFFVSSVFSTFFFCSVRFSLIAVVMNVLLILIAFVSNLMSVTTRLTLVTNFFEHAWLMECRKFKLLLRLVVHCTVFPALQELSVVHYDVAYTVKKPSMLNKKSALNHVFNDHIQRYFVVLTS